MSGASRRPAKAPFLLHPHYVPKPWGGRRLADELGRASLPEGPIGESWEAIDTDEHVSLVDGGDFEGRTLREAWGEPFPLLLKILDAREDLSVQLHPDGHDGGPAKEEAWVALAPGGSVALARDGAPPADDAEWMAAMERVPLVGPAVDRTPSIVHVPPGRVHAVLAGSLVFEVQNPYNVTWRLYDHGRVGIDGQPRELHRQAASAVLARGSQPAAPLEAEGRRLRGTRFALEVWPAGRRVIEDAIALFTLGPAYIADASGRLLVPGGRTAVLPASPCVVESEGWVVAVSDAPPPPGRQALQA